MNMYDLWMRSWAASWMDSRVDIRGNSECSSSAIATVLELGCPYPQPNREDIVSWLKNNDRQEDIEYLMEEF